MSELIAVKGDENNHGAGALLADNNADKFFVGGIKVVMVGSNANIDGFDHPDPIAQTGTSHLFVSGIQVHRNNDLRNCGAKTIVTHQSKVFSG